MVDWGARYRWFFVVHIRGIAGSEFKYDSAIEKRHIAQGAILDGLRKTNRPIWQMCQQSGPDKPVAGVTITGRVKIC